MQSRLTRLALLGLTLLFLPACALLSKPPVPVRHSPPPAALLADCSVPTLDPATNAELVDGVLALLDSLASCNDDKAALRQWADELRGAP